MAHPLTSLVPPVTFSRPAPGRVTCRAAPPRAATPPGEAAPFAIGARTAHGARLGELVVGPALLAAWLGTAVAFVAACW